MLSSPPIRPVGREVSRPFPHRSRPLQQHEKQHLSRADAAVPRVPMGSGDALTPSDEELLARYRDTGCSEDFTEFFRRHADKLRRYLSRYLGNATLAEDVLQEAFLRVHAKCRLYRDDWPARPWLYAIAVHCAVDLARRARRLSMMSLDGAVPDGSTDGLQSILGLLESEKPGPLDELERQEDRRWVRRSMERLSDHQRQALELAYDRGMNYPEIASLLQIPLGTVKSRLHDAVARLRKMANRPCGRDGPLSACHFQVQSTTSGPPPWQQSSPQEGCPERENLSKIQHVHDSGAVSA